ncbi:hypothetical protein Zmor_007031 [Zophobas morio]|uniref:Uncharacterized protein n=1 Tax=Zophobas morio TaxID=2755281 RepID=A0AA38IY52_9CUCU|nr:hypothetical protein Zmor_007031 [Zophobas morio]
MNFKKDAETGEEITRLNLETGEVEFIITSKKLPAKPKVFRIPTSCMNLKKREEKIKFDSSPTFTAALVFLLPTTIFFSPILGLLVVLIEVIIHVWAHRKNKLIRHKNLYYQSPLHIICKEYCGACKEEESKIKITKFQEKRADKFKKYGFEYFKRIVT